MSEAEILFDVKDGLGVMTLMLPVTFWQKTTPILVPVITSALTQTDLVGVGTSYQITATNSPTSFSATGLPPSYTITPSNGYISATPSTA